MASQAIGQLFSRDTQSIFFNFKQKPVQRMLDFDFLCGERAWSAAGARGRPGGPGARGSVGARPTWRARRRRPPPAAPRPPPQAARRRQWRASCSPARAASRSCSSAARRSRSPCTPRARRRSGRQGGGACGPPPRAAPAAPCGACDVRSEGDSGGALGMRLHVGRQQAGDLSARRPPPHPQPLLPCTGPPRPRASTPWRTCL
jgi:hypothetical protein